MPSTDGNVHDALIIGGGPADLATAITLARQLHTAVVFDSGQYRNGLTSHMHMVLTWDHKDPENFRNASRKNILEGYQTITFVEQEIKHVSKENDYLFNAVDGQGEAWSGRKLVLATGVEDIYPDIDGYADCWVSGIFHCLFCHGYEERKEKHTASSSGVFAVDDLAAPMRTLHFARNALQLTPVVALYTNGSSSLKEELAKAISPSPDSFKLDDRPIARLEKGSIDAQVIIHFRDGTSKTEGFVGHKPKTVLKGPFAKELGLELAPTGNVNVTGFFGTTSVRGVFVAGDAASPMSIVNQALYSGASAGAGVACQLQADLLGQKGLV